MDFVDKMPQHGLGDLEIGNHPVTHGSNRQDVARGFAQHVFGFQAHGQNTVFGAVARADSHNGRLAQYDSLALHVHKGVGRTKINGKIIGKHA